MQISTLQPPPDTSLQHYQGLFEERAPQSHVAFRLRRTFSRRQKPSEIRFFFFSSFSRCAFPNSTNFRRRLQGFRASERQSFRASGLQGCRASGLQGVRAAGLQGCRAAVQSGSPTQCATLSPDLGLVDPGSSWPTSGCCSAAEDFLQSAAVSPLFIHLFIAPARKATEDFGCCFPFVLNFIIKPSFQDEQSRRLNKWLSGYPERQIK